MQYVRGRGEVLHAFQAALAEELTVAAGDTARTALGLHGFGHTTLHFQWSLPRMSTVQRSF